jgi:hypothetical protein
MGGQHIKTMAGDHGLKHDGDAIVIRRSFRPKPCRAAVKSPVALADQPWVASDQADPTEPAKRP